MTLTTDEIIDICDNITRQGEEGKSVAKHLAEHGLDTVIINRVILTIAASAIADSPSGKEVLMGARGAFLLGLQLGAMRLEPIDFEEPDREPCTCILCRLQRGEIEDL